MTAEGSNGALLATYGPSRTIASTSAPPTIASDDADSISVRHGIAADAAARRCGNADPTVSAPMSTPSAAPRRFSNQPAAIFIPGGYTHASAAPVQTRSTISSAGPAARTSAAFDAAASTQPIANRRRALITSGRLASADTSVPITNPPCTAIVSHAVSAPVRWNSATIGPFAAVAENQSVIPQKIASDSHASCHGGDAAANTRDAESLMRLAQERRGPLT